MGRWGGGGSGKAVWWRLGLSQGGDRFNCGHVSFSSHSCGTHGAPSALTDQCPEL